MYSRNDDDHNKSLYLVLSISLHILVLLLIIHFTWENAKKESLAEPRVEAPQEVPLTPPAQRVAALKPRASQFGAPVIFSEEPTFTPKDTAPDQDNPLSKPEMQEDMDTHESVLPRGVDTQTPHEQPKPAAEPTLPHQEEVAKTPAALHKEVAATQEKSPATKQASKTTESQQHKPSKEPEQAEKEAVIQEPAQTQGRQQKLPALHTKQPPLTTRDQSDRHKLDAAPMTRKPTFADLAKGFIQTIKNEGQDLMERKGDETIRPDLEEMKLISYKQKVVWAIQNAFRIRGDEEPPHPESLVKCYTLLTIDGDGNIIDLQLAYSTGVAAFDRYYLEVLASAAPFAPLPSYIKAPFVFPFTMGYYTQNHALSSGKRRSPPPGLKRSMR